MGAARPESSNTLPKPMPAGIQINAAKTMMSLSDAKTGPPYGIAPTATGESARITSPLNCVHESPAPTPNATAMLRADNGDIWFDLVNTYPCAEIVHYTGLA